MGIDLQEFGHAQVDIQTDVRTADKTEVFLIMLESVKKRKEAFSMTCIYSENLLHCHIWLLQFYCSHHWRSRLGTIFFVEFKSNHLLTVTKTVIFLYNKQSLLSSERRHFQKMFSRKVEKLVNLNLYNVLSRTQESLISLWQHFSFNNSS